MNDAIEKLTPGGEGGSGICWSAEQGLLAAALAAAQGAFEPIGKTREVTVQMKTGGSYKFSYAPLDTVLAAVRPALAENGLALLQEISGDDTRFLTTTLMHASGEWRSSTIRLPGQASTAQEFGSQVTYARRYAIQCVLGVVAEEDDDGNGADGNDWSKRDKDPPKARERSRAAATPPAQGQTTGPRQTAAHPIEAQLLKAGIPKVRVQRWLMDTLGTANWRVFTDEHMALLQLLTDAWVGSGKIDDDAHGAKAMELAERIAAAKVKK